MAEAHDAPEVPAPGKNQALLITIDGPAGAGKTTVSRALAQRLGYRYIDTGALYRGIALAANEQDIDPADEAGLDRLCAALALSFVRHPEKGIRLLSNGRDITDLIRTPEISMMASAVSARPVVRKRLLELQREMGRDKAAVFEGRDMGTVVFPDADVKFFLSASPEARALRRYRELRGEYAVSLEEIENDMRQRDENDSTRRTAPLKPADDAIMVDSTHFGIEEVIDRMLLHIEKSSAKRGGSGMRV